MGLALDPARPVTVKYGEGCVHCRGTGYLGRTGIYEVMEVNDKIRPLITEKSSAAYQARSLPAPALAALSVHVVDHHYQMPRDL